MKFMLAPDSFKGSLSAEQAVQDKTADAEAQDGDILAGILQHTQRPFFGITVLHRHQGKRQRREHQPADAPDRGVQLVGRDVGAVMAQRMITGI